MFGLLRSALFTFAGFAFSSATVKFLVYSTFFLIVALFINFISTFLPSFSSVSNLFNSLPSGMWYFLNLARVDFGLPLVASAWATRFLIRRVPFVG